MAHAEFAYGGQQIVEAINAVDDQRERCHQLAALFAHVAVKKAAQRRIEREQLLIKTRARLLRVASSVFKGFPNQARFFGRQTWPSSSCHGRSIANHIVLVQGPIDPCCTRACVAHSIAYARGNACSSRRPFQPDVR